MQRARIHITGIVQGVGMRPHVFRLAVRHAITGSVLNAGDGVHIEAWGTREQVDAFVRDVRDEAPAAACIDSLTCDFLDEQPSAEAPRSFTIVASSEDEPRTTLVSPDIATCSNCLRELFDPTDRRYHYPFINCTDCGPRYTIIDGLPYDRAKTSMARFPMCATCAAEYADPLDRRFHAQPDACFECGPHITWREGAGMEAEDARAEGTVEELEVHDDLARLRTFRGTDASTSEIDSASSASRPLTGAPPIGGDRVPTVGRTRAESDAIIERCAALLAGGGIVAIKGLGGFHLACNAGDERAVAELRRRKRRPAKPLAAMVRGVEEARALCEVDPTEEALLTGSVRPIVLLRRRSGSGAGEAGCGLDVEGRGAAETVDLGRRGVDAGSPNGPGDASAPVATLLAQGVVCGLPELGVMLPYTPLQHLIMAACAEVGVRALVMTSGNVSGMPIETDDALAWEHLVESGLADALLGNDRPIVSRFDDSVVRVVAGLALPVRRARGYAPRPIALPSAGAGAGVCRGSHGSDAARPHAEGTDTSADAMGATGVNAASPNSEVDANPASQYRSLSPFNCGDSKRDNQIDAPFGVVLDSALPSAGAVPAILACGSEQKATLALVRGDACFLSQHIGDVEGAETLAAWHEARERMGRLFDIRPTALACDLHPSYLASRWAREEAREQGIPLVEVQHHHAHIAATMAEHGCAGPVLGVSLDGTGAGTDGTVWGGELIVCDLAGFERTGHLAPWRLPGGAASVRDPRRCALSLLMARGLDGHPGARILECSLGEGACRITRQMVERGLNSPLTSSAGRLLDACAALLGICGAASYDGEPAIALEAAATQSQVRFSEEDIARYQPNVVWIEDGYEGSGGVSGDGLSALAKGALAPDLARRAAVGEREVAGARVVIDPTPMLRALLDDLAAVGEGDAVMKERSCRDGALDVHGQPRAKEAHTDASGCARSAATYSDEAKGIDGPSGSRCEGDTDAGAPGDNSEGANSRATARADAFGRSGSHASLAVEDIALLVHLGFSDAIVHAARELARRRGLRTVAFGGGVFMNRIILERVKAGLERAGLTVLVPQEVPLNDGGLAYGQAAIARARLQG